MGSVAGSRDSQEISSKVTIRPSVTMYIVDEISARACMCTINHDARMLVKTALENLGGRDV